MSKGRLEAFSDAVIAIIMTIMVLELLPPHEPTLEALLGLWPVFLAYVLSFLYVGIYWNNHHHLFQVVHVIDGRVLWANLGLLFSLSLFPFGTAWLGETGFASLPLATYGVILLAAALAYYVLVRTLLRIPAGRGPTGRGDRPGHEGQDLAADLRARGRGRLRGALDLVRALHRGGAALGRPRPAHRAHPGAVAG